MIKLIPIICIFMAAITCQARAETPKEFDIDLQQVKIAEVVHMVYSFMIDSPYIVTPDIVNDQRLISLRYSTKSKQNFTNFWSSFLQTVDLELHNQAGVHLLRKKTSPDDQKTIFTYTPLHREANYLVDIIRPFFSDIHANRPVAIPGVRFESEAPQDSATQAINQKTDIIVYSGTKQKIKELTALLERIDTPASQVFITAHVYEVALTKSDDSAITVALNLLGGRVGVNLGTPVFDNSIFIKSSTIQAALSLFKTDNRFKVITTPSLRVKSGGSATFTVGAEVPTLGSVTLSNNGTPVRSVEYRSSGTIFNIVPNVIGKNVTLDVTQQLSNFVPTSNGVNDSPTLTKRELKTSLNLQDGETVVLGGLREAKNTDSETRMKFLPDFFTSNASDTSETEILIVLQAQIVAHTPM